MEDNITSEEDLIAQTEKIGLGDLAIAGLLAVAVFVLQYLWPFSGMHPALWDEAAVAAGVRPAEHIVPGYLTALLSVVYDVFGIDRGVEIWHLIGHIVHAGLAFCTYMVLREWLFLALRLRPQISVKRTLVVRVAAFIGAAAFVLSDPVWSNGQNPSTGTVHIVLTLAAMLCFMVFLRTGAIALMYVCAPLLGLLASESVLGFLLPPCFIALVLFVMRETLDPETSVFNPSVIEVSKWHITFIYLISVAVGIVFNCWFFVGHGGVDAVGGSIGDVPLKYLVQYWDCIVNAGTFGSWILWLAVCVLPFIVTIIKFPASADEGQLLPYSVGIIFFLCGLIAFSQFVSLQALWFWTHFPMGSQYLLMLGVFGAAVALANGLTILGVDALCRDHQRLAEQMFGDDEEGEEVARPVVLNGLSKLFRRACLLVVPAIMLAAMIPARVQTITREMMEVLNDSIREIVTEAGDAEYLFSDGNLDAAIEFESARRGGHLRCYALVGGGPLAVHLRTRGLEKDSEDMFSFSHDTAMGMRSWIRDKPEKLAKSAALMGFDLWKRDGKALPQMGGYLSRLGGFESEYVRMNGVKGAHAMIDRVFATNEKINDLEKCGDGRISEAFQTLQWRLARMCLYRGEVDDRSGRAEEAIAEVERSKKLNESNTIYKDLVEAMEKRNASMLQRLTPREGLQLSLVRADFSLGKIYAETILGSDPTNPDANFAMGMYYLQQRQLSRAEIYLKRCLIRRPGEAAIYNNLAMIQIELKKFDAAAVNVEKALKLVPNSASVMDTKKMLEQARKQAK